MKVLKVSKVLKVGDAAMKSSQRTIVASLLWSLEIALLAPCLTFIAIAIYPGHDNVITRILGILLFPVRLLDFVWRNEDGGTFWRTMSFFLLFVWVLYFLIVFPIVWAVIRCRRKRQMR